MSDIPILSASPIEVKTKLSFSEVVESSLTRFRMISGDELHGQITAQSLLTGEIPRLSPLDEIDSGYDVRLVKIPEGMRLDLARERATHIAELNSPDRFLARLRKSREPFVVPDISNSSLLERLHRDHQVVGFNDLRLESPVPRNGERRVSRTSSEANIEENIAGQARIPIAMGAMPDIGSALAYSTMAMMDGFAFVSRDKVLSDINSQVELVGLVLDTLRTCELPEQMIGEGFLTEKHLREFWEIMEFSENFDINLARDRYIIELRESWINNIIPAVEASEKGFERAKKLIDAGVKGVRIYSPEGGWEIIEATERLNNYRNERLREGKGRFIIVAGQIMHIETALEAEQAGVDVLIIGVAGGGNCITSEKTDIPVNVPSLMHLLRGRVKIPLGIEGGGVGSHLIDALTLGASFVCKSGELISLETVGGKYCLQESAKARHGSKQWRVLHSGEASGPSKWWRQLTNTLGQPRFVEGESSYRSFKELRSMSTIVRELLEAVSDGLVFQRRPSITALHLDGTDRFVQVSDAADRLSSAYSIK